MIPSLLVDNLVFPYIRPEMKNVTNDFIIKKVCSYYGITKTHLKSSRRIGLFLEARRIAVPLIHFNSQNSIVERRLPMVTIGVMFGGKDHTTVLWTCRKALDFIQYDKKYIQDCKIICKQIGVDFDLFKKHLIVNFTKKEKAEAQ